MNSKNEKAISLRLSKELYQKCVDLAIKKSNSELRIVNISEIIREILNINLTNENK